MLNNILFFLLLFLYIFNIIPPIGPSKIGTRIYIGIIWFVFLLCSSYINRKTVLKLLLLNVLLILSSLLTVLVNNTSDFWYVQFAILNVTYISGALLLVYLLSPVLTSFYKWLEFIIYCILINSLISFAGFIYNPIMLFITSIQELGSESLIEGTINWGVRALGFGSGNFFFGGVINGFGLIFICYLIRNYYFSMKKGLFLLLILFFTGMFIARTTIIGLFLGLILLLYRIKIKRLILLLFSSISLCTLLFFSSSLFENINTSWAFDFIQNFFSGGKATNSSLETLDEMWKIDMSLKSFLIGDGLSKYDDGSYYMHTDVGYLRNILYFGILGTVFGYFLYAFLICKLIVKEAFYIKDIKLLIRILYAFLLITNYKGLPDFNFILFLIIAYFIINKNKTLVRNANS